MTSTVIVQAHPADGKEVVVKIADKVTGVKTGDFVMQSGETAQHVVYDNLVLTVTEVAKS